MKADYHVHYYIDGCAADEMTFPNIEKKALELGLDEISVLKHHSRRMPNGEAVWVCWKRVKPDEWQRYLDEYAAYRPEKLTIHSGVESELCGEDGEINISDEEAAKIDMVALSVHYMPDLDGLKMDFLLYPDLNFCPEQNNEEGRRELARWREKAAAFGAENAVKGLVNGYCNAIRAHKKVRTLSHMYDGLLPLRTYTFDVDALGEKRCIELFEPLFAVMRDNEVRWELTGGAVRFPGILRRADCRGKSLPPLLEAALRMQAGLDPPTPILGEAKAYHINQRDEGFDGYNGDLTGDVAATLGVNCGMSTGRNGIVTAAFSAGAGASAGSIGYHESVAPTLKAGASGNCMPSVLCINDQGGQVMEISENMTGTLRAQEHGHQPLVYENHGIDSRYRQMEEVAPTMSARYGTGGNNVPLVEQEPVICITGNAIDRQPQNGGNGIGYQQDIAYTLTATDHHAVYSRQRVDDFRENAVVSTQSARQCKDAVDLVCQKADVHAHLIRRLTPLECERLQGFPDGWTDIPGASDSARYKALGNSVAIPCVDFVMHCLVQAVQMSENIR